MELPIETVQEYPRPPAMEHVPHRLRIWLAGEVVADSMAGFRVLETHHAPTYYIPPDDIAAMLTPADGTSFCEWKGTARYWDVTAGGRTAGRAAWSYDAPEQGFEALAGLVAFYAGLMEECRVGDIAAIQQPGDFYGGWTTPNLRGPIKGAAGTRHW
ncbi:DUF427 domain-containing protein [Sulfitobacter sabulilitoris]|uniref:DUF427 domain-containing protein n=1 Tax=Sulfitobacter sabulilitoris TaxID=2562655 RepID=A0A5S3PHC4_9RHOB|nr:DUF427 domain-containing protein [Sulfitobacter sabulilitoris]TMM51164.1 DUF427 domain-containing protein [Sulfitobacter sabulilitoris]